MHRRQCECPFDGEMDLDFFCGACVRASHRQHLGRTYDDLEQLSKLRTADAPHADGDVGGDQPTGYVGCDGLVEPEFCAVHLVAARRHRCGQQRSESQLLLARGQRMGATPTHRQLQLLLGCRQLVYRHNYHNHNNHHNSKYHDYHNYH